MDLIIPDGMEIITDGSVYAWRYKGGSISSSLEFKTKEEAMIDAVKTYNRIMVERSRWKAC